MSPISPDESTVRPTAAVLNARIRDLVSKCRVWTPGALAELHRLQVAYLDAQRAEAALSRGDVARVA
ncbi:MAG: hypothetical protein HOW97_02355 [Catenulispora sp.]|nr:hypothetical protein [Catenulispora sp.]